ncbi:hypothetical protein B0H19DRAFT_1301069 [Mycena capillaripes]|nr:hypothetical protein B0H19DRAFT_1301069 [Mycena capillaripes]
MEQAAILTALPGGFICGQSGYSTRIKYLQTNTTRPNQLVLSSSRPASALPCLPSSIRFEESTEKLLLTSSSRRWRISTIPACLTGCTLAFFHNINEKYVWETVSALREGHHLFLDRCIAFLTLERTLAELEAACDAWVGCACDLDDALVRKLHDLVPRGEEPTLDTLARHVVAVVHAILQPAKQKGGVHKVAHNAKKAAKQRKNVLWPKKPSDLLPYGPDSSVRAMGYWIERAPKAIWIGLVGSMLEICKRSMIPPLIASPYIPEKSVGMVEIPVMLHLFLRASPSRQAKATPASLLADMKRCAAGLESVRPIARNVKPYTSETEQDATYIENVFIPLAATVHCHLELPYDPKTYPPIVLANSLSILETEDDPSIIAFQAFYQLACHERCCSPGCTETFASQGRKFSLCSGCSRVPFCSKQCLTTAWKYPNVAHRDVCKKIMAVSVAGKLAAKPAAKDVLAFKANLTKAGVDEADIADIAMHVQRLFKEMSSAFDEDDKMQFLGNISKLKTLTLEEASGSSDSEVLSGLAAI